jgi:hypothetical protein
MQPAQRIVHACSAPALGHREQRSDVLRSFCEDLKKVADELTAPPEPGEGTLSSEATDHVLWQAARLGADINAMYIGKLDGNRRRLFRHVRWRVAGGAAALVARDRPARNGRAVQDEGMQLLELARNAQRLFGCSGENGKVRATFRRKPPAL